MVAGREDTAGRLPGSAPGWPDPTEALDWMPLASLVLAGDGTARAVSQPIEGPADGPAVHDWPAMAEVLVPRLLAVGLALQPVWSLADGPTAAQLQRALDQLDDIIRDTQAAVLASGTWQHHHDASEQ